MTGFETFLNSLPGHWAIIALIAGIGLSVVFIRGIIRLAFRALLIGTVGVILLGAVYYVLTYTSFSL